MSRKAVLLFAATSVIWGSSFLFIRVAVGHMPPSAVVFGRTPARHRVSRSAGHQEQGIPRPASQHRAGRRGGLARHGPAHLPVVALLLGVGLLGEKLIIGAIAGLILIALGAWLATTRRSQTSTPTDESRTTAEPARRYRSPATNSPSRGPDGQNLPGHGTFQDTRGDDSSGPGG